MDRHRRVGGFHALRHGHVKLALRGVAQRGIEVFQLHQFQIRRARGRERDAIVAVGGGIVDRVCAHLVRVEPGLVVNRMERRPRAVHIVSSLERPRLRATRLVVFPCSAVDLVAIDLLRRLCAEVVRHGNWKFRGLNNDAVIDVGHTRIVVVEQVASLGVAVESSRLRHAFAVWVGRGEVLKAGGDRAVSGEAAHGEVVSVEVERLARRDGDGSEHLVAEKREVVVEGLVDQRVGERAGAVAQRLEAAAHGVVETNGAV